MKKNFVSNSPEPVRIFKSDLLEPLSRVHFYVPLLVYIPVIIYQVYKWFFVLGKDGFTFTWLTLVGLFVWTLVEYVMHRFVFHFVPKSKWGLRLHFIFHGVHHDYPNDLKRLVLPPSASIPLASAFYILFALLLPVNYIYAFYPGFIGGYLIYDMTHYALHFYNFKHPYLKRIKQQHMLHHYADPSKGFGVSSNLWDRVFGSQILNEK